MAALGQAIVGQPVALTVAATGHCFGNDQSIIVGLGRKRSVVSCSRDPIAHNSMPFSALSCTNVAYDVTTCQIDGFLSDGAPFLRFL